MCIVFYVSSTCNIGLEFRTPGWSVACSTDYDSQVAQSMCVYKKDFGDGRAHQGSTAMVALRHLAPAVGTEHAREHSTRLGLKRQGPRSAHAASRLAWGPLLLFSDTRQCGSWPGWAGAHVSSGTGRSEFWASVPDPHGCPPPRQACCHYIRGLRPGSFQTPTCCFYLFFPHLNPHSLRTPHSPRNSQLQPFTLSCQED